MPLDFDFLLGTSDDATDGEGAAGGPPAGGLEEEEDPAIVAVQAPLTPPPQS